MNWFLVALINPFAHAAVNHLDKYLISRYLKGHSVGTLILFSSLFAVLALPVIVFLDPGVFHSITFFQALALMFNGAVLVAAILLYLYALASNEASYVAPFFQFIPIFGFLLSYFILGEVLSFYQVMAICLIVFGSIILSLEISAKSSGIKRNLVLLMLGSSFLYAINAVIFKSIAMNQGFLNSLFWDMAGKFLFGIFLFIVVAQYRRQFISLIKKNSLKVLSLNTLNEILALIGEVALILAVLSAPVALVQSVSGLQPAFVLIIGVILTLFFPKIAQESMSPKVITQKVIGIVLITMGVFLI
jgi:drug/metabolite transporter (DMT)-like permease